MKPNRPITICFVTREYAHDKMGSTGGIGVFLKQYVNQLKHHGFNITVFSFGKHAVQFNDDDVKVIKIRDLTGFNEWIKAPLRKHKIPGYITVKLLLEYVNRFYISMCLSFFVLRHKFSIIEFHDYGGDAPYFIGRLPKVVRCHGSALTLHQFMGYHNRITDSVFEKQFFRRIHRNVIAVSDFSAESTQQAFHLKVRPTILHNGVTLPKINTETSYLDPPTQPYAVFYFGSVRERKGIDIACKAFNAIKEQFPKATFHVLGNNNNDYWNTTAIKLLSKKALADTIYYGSIPNAIVYDYLNKAHIVLFPSYGENFSMALLEAMALGKLVVTSPIPAFREVIINGENGFMTSELTEYIKQIEMIFKDKIDIQRISNNARATVAAKFQWQDIIPQNINYYKALLNG